MGGFFGESEAAVRSLSACAAACAVPALYGLGRRLFGERTGVTAALLLALNPLFVQHAQNARSYGLLVALTLSSFLFVEARRHPSSPSGGGYAATTGALAIYAHYVAAYVVLVHVAPSWRRDGVRSSARVSPCSGPIAQKVGGR